MAAVVTTPPAALAGIAPLLGNLRNFLGTHGYPVRDFAPAPIAGGVPTSDSGLSLPGEVDFSPSVLRQLQTVQARYGQRGALTPAQVQALEVATHEALHQMRFGRTQDVYASPQGRRWEEGATQAAARDMLPIITAKLFGDRLPGASSRDFMQPTTYPGLVQNIRQLSVFGSGAKRFTDHAARVWRRSFLHADEDQRQAMATAAQQARMQLGPAARPPSPPQLRLPGGPG